MTTAGVSGSPRVAGSARRRLIITFVVFVMLGLPEGVLGTVWPSMRADLGRPVSSLAWLIGGYTLGYLVSTGASGRLSERVGVQRAVQLGVATTAVGLLFYVVSFAWPITVIGSVILGTGAGLVDASINADVALRHGQRVMHFLHAAFGVGATLGPLVATGLVRLNSSWRIAYLVLVAFEVLLLGLLLRRRPEPVDAESSDGAEAVAATTARNPQLVLAASLFYFAVYVGAEVSIGQWSFSILTEERGSTPTAAGMAVAAYWGGLTVGRLLLGVVGDRLHPLTLLRGSVVVALVAGIWFWSDGPGVLVALPVLGLSFAGIFPSLVLLTPGWVGRDRVARAVGLQLSSSSAGAIVSSALLALVARQWGLNAVPAGILVLVTVLSLAHIVTEAASR